MKAIAACDKNFAIGKDGKLLCHIPGDLAYFKRMTVGKTVIMGRKTLESLPGGKPLPKRETIVLSRTLGSTDEYTVAGSIEEAKQLAGDKEVFVCGGEEVYRQMVPLCDEIYLTLIDEEFDADAHFPQFTDDFEKVWESDVQEENGHRYQFVQYKRKK